VILYSQVLNAALVKPLQRKGSRAPDISERLEARQHVERLLEGLDERDRLMLILKEVEGYSMKRLRRCWN